MCRMDRNALVETSKLRLRSLLQRANLSIGRDPAANRLTRTLHHLGVCTVLDVGANIGQFATLLRSAGYSQRIVSFEPLPDAYASLMRRAARDPRWEARQVALGERTGKSTINVAQNSYSSSLLSMNSRHLAAAPASRFVKSVEVPIQRLAELKDELAVVPRRTLLKVDTQGYESQVLDGAGDIVDTIAAIQLELSLVTLYQGQALFDDLRNRMSDSGLALFSLEAGFSDATGRLLQCDGLFVRESLIHEPSKS
jgi:FkbM family methyltransferase